MAIVRIEKVVYGVDDLPACVRFFADVGLEHVRSDRGGALFRTPVNQHVELRRSSDSALPSAPGPDVGIRELIWGVDSGRGLESIRQELSRDRGVTNGADGTLHSRDDTGYAIAFKIADPAPAPEVAHAVNSSTRVERINRERRAYGRAHPISLMHVALNIPDAGHREASDFYIGRLGFRPIDDVRTVGMFMQCEGDLQHHNLLLCHRSDRISINHLAVEMRDVDELIEGGNFLTEQGWKESRRLGRHTLGSNLFRFFHAPCGGRLELAHDMDRMDKSFKARVWEQPPPHHLWMLKFPGERSP